MHLRICTLIAVALTAFLFAYDKQASAANPDQFPGLDPYNSASRQLRETGEWSWYYSVASGCNGNIRPAIEAAMQNVTAETGIRFYEGSGWRMRVSCGLDMSTSCGTNTQVVACLGEGYPYNVNIKFRDIMSTYTLISQIAVVLHEMFGHAMGTWNEQYSFINGNFYCDPVLDIMTCGSTSWHYIGPTERARFERTMMPSRIAEAYLDLNARVVWHSPSNDRATRTAVFTQEMRPGEWGPFEWTGLHGCLGGVLGHQCWASPIPSYIPPCTAVFVVAENGIPLSWGGVRPDRVTYAGGTPC